MQCDYNYYIYLLLRKNIPVDYVPGMFLRECSSDIYNKVYYIHLYIFFLFGKYINIHSSCVLFLTLDFVYVYVYVFFRCMIE